MGWRDVEVVIPARWNSARLKNKAAFSILGKPLLQWTWERALSLGFKTTILTEDKEVESLALGFGANVFLNDNPYYKNKIKNGTAACRAYGRITGNWGDIMVNIQGDTPVFDREILLFAIEKRRRFRSGMRTFYKEVSGTLPTTDMVKLVTSRNDKVLYFSRSNIPYGADMWKIHTGIYVYSFRDCAGRMPTHLVSENLEQLAWAQKSIHAHKMKYAQSVDVIDDVPEVEKLLIAGV